VAGTDMATRFQQQMTLVDVAFDVYKSRGAFDPRNGRPLHSLYRYSGPLGPAYVGWTEDDQMTWVDGPEVGAANLDWGPGASVTTLDEQEALREGVALRVPNQAIRVSGPYGRWGVFLKFESEAHEWILEGKRYKGFNRRGTASNGEVLGLLSNRAGKRGFQAKVNEDIERHEVVLFIFCWASLLQTVKLPRELDFGPQWYGGPTG
jgi:hypothetical protein